MTVMVSSEKDPVNNGKNGRIAVFLTLFGMIVRLIGLGQHSYWFDEAREVLRSLTPWPDILLVSEGVDPPLYRLLLFPIATVTVSEFWLRLPSALFSAAAIYLAFYWLRLMGYPRLGIATAVLLAFSPIQIYYAQEVSQYSMVVFLALLILISFERAARYGRWRDWILLTLVSLVSMYTYYGLAWLLPVLDIDLAWRTWKQRTRQRLMGFINFHIVLTVGLAGLYMLLLRMHIDRFTTRKNLVPSFLQPGLRASLQTLDDELLTRFVRFFFVPFSPTTPEYIIFFLAGLVVVGAIFLWFHGTSGRRIVIYLVTVTGTMYVANGLGLYPFGNRYALAVMPLYFVAIAAVIWGLWRWQSPAGWAMVGVIALGFISFWPNIQLIPNPWQVLPREELRPVVAYVHEQAQSGDFIYVYYGANPAYQVYQPDPVYPTEFGPWFRQSPPEEKVDDIQQVVADYQRFWLVLSHIHGDEYDEIVNGLANSTPSYQVADEYVAQNAAAVLLRRSE